MAHSRLEVAICVFLLVCNGNRVSTRPEDHDHALIVLVVIYIVKGKKIRMMNFDLEGLTRLEDNSVLE